MHKFMSIVLALILTVTSFAPRAHAQFVDNGNTPAQNVRNRGARSPGLLVRAGIANRAQGGNITQAAPPDLNLRVNLLTELIRNIFATLAGLVPFLPTLFDNPTDPVGGGNTGGGGGVAGGDTGLGGGVGLDDVVITEVAHNGNVVLVELLNRGPIQQRIDGWRFHDGINVSPPLPVIELDRLATIVVQLGGETPVVGADAFLPYRVQSIASGELALYNFSPDEDVLPIEDSSRLIDYIQWNDTTLERDPPLENVAVSANLWGEIDFIPSSLANMTFQLDGAAEPRMTTSSQDITIAPFSENTLGTAGSALAGP